MTFYPQTEKTVLWDEKHALGVSGNPLIVDPDGVTVQPVSVVANGGTTLNTSQVTVGATATLIAAANANRKSIAIINNGTVDIFLGASGVTTSTGALLVGVKGSAIILEVTAAIYGIVTSGSQSVSIAEIV